MTRSLEILRDLAQTNFVLTQTNHLHPLAGKVWRGSLNARRKRLMAMKESQATADEESGARTKMKQYRKHTCIETWSKNQIQNTIEKSSYQSIACLHHYLTLLVVDLLN